MPISAVDTIRLAFQHTKQQLFQPFRFGQWVRLAVVGLLAGEMGGSGGRFNFPANFPRQSGGSSRQFLSQAFPHIDPAILWPLITVLVVTGLVFLIVMMYVSSVMRFILFDSVLKRECHIRDGWSCRQGAGWKFFLWQLGLFLASIAGFAVLLGVPAGFAFGLGWFTAPREHVLALVLTGIFVLFLVLFFALLLAVTYVLTKDFVIPQMALENIDTMEGWRRLWPMIQAEQGGYAAYVGMKIVMAIGAGIVIGIASLILIVIVMIPVGGLGLIAVITGKSAGLTWNAFTITVAIVIGCIVFAILMFLTALIAVPAIVFFPAYSIYFFAPRYRPLSLVLYPPPPQSPPPAVEPIPQPIG